MQNAKPDGFVSFSDAKKICTEKGVKSMKGYAAFRKDNLQHGLPASPNSFYPEWVSWPQFLGKTPSLKIVHEARDGESLPGFVVSGV